MKAISFRSQLWLVGMGYAVVVAAAAVLVGLRYLQYVTHRADAAAYSTMWGFGDWMLAIFIGCMLLVPTFALAVIARKNEHFYTAYSKVLLGLSLTLPLGAGLMAIPAIGQGQDLVGDICLYRLLGSPVVLAALGFSRLLARFARAKWLTSFALAIEAVTLAVVLVLLFTGGHG
jgi:hypothetical protein